MQVEDKIVDGQVYEAVKSPDGSCRGCAAWDGDNENSLCDALTENRCAFDYVWKIKDVTESKSVQKEGTSKVQGMKFDDNKIQYSLVPPYALAELAKCLTFGAKKYKPDNWKWVQDAKKRYLDAALRHIELVRQGEEYDQESGAHHFTCAMANLAFLVEFAKNPELSKGETK